MGRLGLLLLLVAAAGWWWSRPPVPVANSVSVSQVAPATPLADVVDEVVLPRSPSRPRQPAVDSTEKPRQIATLAALNQATALGWQAIQSSRYDEALGYFQQAADGGPADAMFGLAVAYYRLQRPDESLMVAHQAAALLPQKAGVWRLLGQLSYDAGDLVGAVEAWERAQGIDFDAKLAPLIDTARHDQTTNSRFFVGETRHFRARFEGPEIGYLAERVLDILEAAYSSVGLALGYYPDKMIETVLYTQQAFYDVTRSPSWAGGIYDGKVRLPISGADQDPKTLRRVVTHEYVHAAVAELLGRRQIPAWLQEGLALNLEGTDPAVLSRWSRNTLPKGTGLMPLSRISGSLLGLSSAEADRAYAQSYVLVASLIDRFGTYRLADLLHSMENQPFADSFLVTYGETPDAALGRALSELHSG
jgi:tetratricopeptide (TPR) repeat protein